MSDLKLNAEVVVDNSKSIAPLKDTAAAVSDAKTAILDAGKAATTASADLSKLDATAKDVATTAGAALAPALVDAKTAIAETGTAATTASGSIEQLDKGAKDVANTAKTKTSPAIREVVKELNDARTASTAAATEVARVTRSAGALVPAINTATRSVGSMKAGSAQLGQQLQDVGVGIQAGTSFFTIFAQQGGQVAYALSQMEGKAGALGAALSGPLGAGLILVVSLAGPFIAKMLQGGDAAETHAKKARTLADALGDLDKATGRSIRTADEAIRQSVAEITALQNREIATRRLTRAKLDQAIVDQQLLAQRAGSGIGTNDAVGLGATSASASSVIAGLRADLAANDAKLASIGTELRGAVRRRVSDDVKEIVDPVFKITRAYEATVTDLNNAFARTGDTKALSAGLLAAERTKTAQLDGIRQVEAAERKRISAGAAGERAAVRETARLQKAGLAERERAEKAFRASLASLTAANGTALQTNVNTANTARDRQLGKDSDDLVQSLDKSGAYLAKTVLGAGKGFGDQVGRAGDRVASNFGDIALQLGKNLINGDSAGKGIDLAAAGGDIAGSIASSLANTFLNEALAPIIEPLTKVATILGKVAAFLVKYTSGIGLLTALLSKPKTGSATLANVAGVGEVVSTSGNNQKRIEQATKLGDSIIGTIQGVVDQLGGRLGDFSASIGIRNKKYVVDPTGAGRTKGSGTTKYKEESDAISAVIADALRDGAVGGVSPRVQAVLQQYATNVDKAVAEALKVKGLEDLLADDADPFASLFRDDELLRSQRLITARQYGFDIVAIEKLNAKEREAAIKSALESTTGTVKALLADLAYGSRATGSAAERQVSLSAERDRLAGLVRGGDDGQLDALAKISQQLIDLETETYGSTQTSSRDSTTALLNDLVRQTEDRIRASAKAAEDATKATNGLLTELNATGDDQVAALAQQTALLQEIVGKLTGAYGGTSFGSLTGNYERSN